jgi:hypothetical protein
VCVSYMEASLALSGSALVHCRRRGGTEQNGRVLQVQMQVRDSNELDGKCARVRRGLDGGGIRQPRWGP